jgi:predicted nucleic acid-binding protein
MIKTFVDTSAFLALLNGDDKYHDFAKIEWIRLITSKSVLVSSNYIIVETISLLQRRFGIDAVKLFTSDVQPINNIVWVDEKIHDSALLVVKTLNQRHLSLVDCTSFGIMQQMGIEYVFTFDSHFSDQGFKLIPNMT